MKSSFQLHFLIISTLSFPGYTPAIIFLSGNITRKENVITLIDVDQNKHSLSSEVLKQVLDGISLRRYRIAFHSTNGVSKRVNEFQSKKCLLQSFQ